ncbi:MAG: hypothetical protein PVJ57_09125 [Phycisphaerae bacterium]|jgi:hypothetical protein
MEVWSTGTALGRDPAHEEASQEKGEYMRKARVFMTLAALVVLPALSGPTMALTGDLNCDGAVDNFDISPFVLALTATPPDYLEYYALYPDCDHMHADVNGDGAVDNFDISPFVQLLLNGGPVHDVELAGNSLAAYPYFTYVSAFNAGKSVEMAIDPTMYPDIIGTTADVYVVASKTAADWQTDPALVDVRTGGPQTVAFGGTTIQDNTIVLDTGTLDADAGTGLGVSYDVVLDCDQDGVLSGGDYIDGRSSAAGFYVVHDLTQAGPLATTSITYSGGSWLGQRTWYPTAIASLGQLPLIVISHGNGHDYTWYDYLQSHLASYGYVVMSHQNNTQPGIESASTTTLTNTDYFLDHLDTINGGIFDGHIDTTRIVWIGHSRGGEGVARAYDRVYDGTYTPSYFTLDDIVLVSSIAPTDFLGTGNADPHGVPYHLIYGAADGDVGGYPDNDIADSFNVYERATGFRQVTYVHGADHNDFNCCGVNDFEGPPGTAIGRPEAQQVAKGAYLALIQHYVEANIPAKDFLWRQNEALKPIGVAASDTIDREYKEPAAAGGFVIDDFQSEPSLTISSSGGAVAYNVQNPWEGLMNDVDGSFTWSTDDPMNGMTRARTTDTTAGLVFDWTTTADRYLDFTVVPGANDFSDYAFLSFRACQGTRHTQTVAELGDLTFTVALEDGDGYSSSINIGAYGGGIEEPYQRTGDGSGAGWQNEFETIRIRLTDFLHNGAALDLTDVQHVRFDFGSSYGSSRGRVALDDLQLSKDRGPGGLTVRVLNAPQYLPPNTPYTLQVRIAAANETYVPGTALLHYRYDGNAFLTLPLNAVGDDVFEQELPGATCSETPEFYVSAEGSESGLITDPPGAPAYVYGPMVGTFTDFIVETMDSDPGWTTQGLWAYGQPTGGGGQYGENDPTSGFTGPNVYGYNLSGDYENNLPERHLTTPAINCTGYDNVHLSFYRWLGVEQPRYDHAYVRVSTNGSSWTTVWTNAAEITDSSWNYQEFDISSIAANQATVYIRWTMGTTDTSWQYCGWNIDDVRLSSFGCD